MMKNANGDTLAYPAPNIIGSGSHNTINAPSGTGLTKRELFAAMAMQGLIQDARIESSPAGLAAEATWYADALLAALDASRPVEPKP